MSENLEVIVNLWYVMDEDGIVYSLRAKLYVELGDDEEKLAFLKQRANLDYLIAEPFEIPERFHVQVDVDDPSKTMPVSHIAAIQTLSSPIELFEDALQVVEDRFPAQSGLEIPQDPLVCTTPLMQNEDGVIDPRIEGEFRY